ncbi:hypothetical protein MNBD_ALPHA12-644, partial [hydrothermal vent metagenome]
QQIRGQNSVPDAQISQRPFDIFIEAKLDGALDENQLERHIKSINGNKKILDGSLVYLIGLTKEDISEKQIKTINKIAEETGVIFIATTFTRLSKILDESVADFERSLQEIADDFRSYLDSADLIDHKLRMLVRPTRATMKENEKYSFYCEPIEQPNRSHANYFGLYEDKTVKYIGKIERVFEGKIHNGRFEITDTSKGAGSDTDADTIVQAADEVPLYSNLKSHTHRFYFVDGFKKTRIQKSSPRGIWRAKYLDLGDASLLGDIEDVDKIETQEIAEKLKGKEFE